MPTVTINIPRSVKIALDEKSRALVATNPPTSQRPFWCRALVKTNYNCLGELKPFVSCRSSRELFNSVALHMDPSRARESVCP